MNFQIQYDSISIFCEKLKPVKVVNYAEKKTAKIGFLGFNDILPEAVVFDVVNSYGPFKTCLYF